MKRFQRGLQQGLNESLEGSGVVLGMLLPFAVVILVIATVVSWRGGCSGGCVVKSGPTICTDYTFKVGLLDDNAMSCTRWPAMKMSVNERWIKADVVTCTCTPESFPKPEQSR